MLALFLSIFLSNTIIQEFDAKESLQFEKDINQILNNPEGTLSNEKFKIVRFEMESGNFGREEENALFHLSSGVQTYLREVDPNLFFGYGIQRDASQKPVSLIRVDFERPIHLQGLVARKFLILAIVISCGAALVFTLYLFSSKIINKTYILSKALRHITTEQDWTKRVESSKAQSEVLSTSNSVITCALSFVMVCASGAFYVACKQIYTSETLVIAFSCVLTGFILGRSLNTQILEPILALNPDQKRTRGSRDPLENLTKDINALLSALEYTQQQVVIARETSTEQTTKLTFVAKVSHELRTPLHVIIGLLRIIQKNDPRPLTRHYLGLVRDSAKGLLGTINEILDFSKADAGMLGVKIADTDLRAIIREAMRTVMPKAFEKTNLELVCSLAPGVPEIVETDGGKLRQVLTNLLGNAIKFTAKGHVELRVHLKEEVKNLSIIEFTISDTGIGIPSNRLATIFDPFTQVDMTVVRKFQGTGLGLTIVKQITTALSGEISVSSKQNSGTNFQVAFPVRVVKKNELTTYRKLQGKNVWILSTSPHFSEILRSDLKVQGCESEVLSPENSLTKQILESNFLIVEGKVLCELESWTLIEKFVNEKGKESVIAVLHPSDLSFHERLLDIGIEKILTLPVLSDDVVKSVGGAYVDSVSEWNNDAETLKSTVPLSVLIADDVVTNQIILKSMLEEAGHAVVAVDNGEQLVDVIGHQCGARLQRPQDKLFDVILTDIQMPKMDGITAIKTIRQNEKTHNRPPLPILAVTAHAFDEERQRILAAGANEVVTKPIELRKLEAALNAVSPRTQERTPEPSVSKPVVNFTGDTLIAVVQSVLAVHNSGITIDINGVYERSGDSPRRSLLIFKAFLGGYGPILESLREIEKTGQTAALQKEAHSLKGILLEVGATEVGEAAKQIEIHAKEGAFDKAQALLRGVIEATEQVSELVKESVMKLEVGSTEQGVASQLP